MKNIHVFHLKRADHFKPSIYGKNATAIAKNCFHHIECFRTQLRCIKCFSNSKYLPLKREKPGSLAKHSLPKWKGLTKKIQGSLNTEKSRWDCKRKAYKSMRLLFSRVTNGRVAFLYCR